MSVRWDCGAVAHGAQTISRHRYPSSPLLSLLQSCSLPELKRGILSLFLCFFLFLPPSFSNLSVLASLSLSLVASERGGGDWVEEVGCIPTHLSSLRWKRFIWHAAPSLIQIKIEEDGSALDSHMTPLLYWVVGMWFFSPSVKNFKGICSFHGFLGITLNFDFWHNTAI